MLAPKSAESEPAGGLPCFRFPADSFGEVASSIGLAIPRLTLLPKFINIGNT